MKALSLHQPWASLVALGHKTIETREWPPHYAGPLAIHASAWAPGPRQVQDPDSDAVLALEPDLLWPLFPAEPIGRLNVEQRRELLLTLPKRAVLATCRLVDALRIVPADLGAVLVDARGREVRQVPDQELPLGGYGLGRWAWILADVVALDPPRPTRGARKLWEWQS